MVKRGFTLVEIMIVVAIIALLAAIAIPNLLRARVNANETAAISTLRTLSTALESFRAAQVVPTYPAAIALLSAAAPPYVDTTITGIAFAAAGRQGYTYVYTFVNANQYNITGTPVILNTTGVRRFYVDQTGVIRQNAAGAAGPASPPIQ